MVYGPLVGALSVLDPLGLAVGLAGLVVAIAGIVIGVLIARWGRREKALYYRTHAPQLLATARSGIKIVCEREGSPPEVVPEVYLSEIEFANMGREPIRRGDLVVRDRVRAEVRGARVLNVAISRQRRAFSEISIANVRYAADAAVADLDFAFLDHLDGARIQVLTTRPGAALSLSLCGTVVGMPGGIKSMDPVESTAGRRVRRFAIRFALVPLYLGIALVAGIFILTALGIAVQRTAFAVSILLFALSAIGVAVREAESMRPKRLPLDVPAGP